MDYIQTWVEGFKALQPGPIKDRYTIPMLGLVIDLNSTQSWQLIIMLQLSMGVVIRGASHWIQAGIEAGTFRSWVAHSAIWATAFRSLQNCFILYYFEPNVDKQLQSIYQCWAQVHLSGGTHLGRDPRASLKLFSTRILYHNNLNLFWLTLHAPCQPHSSKSLFNISILI